MYKVYCDGKLLTSTKLDDYALISPVVTLEVNKAGSFQFTFPNDHPQKDIVTERKSIIDVYQDSNLIFEGIPTEIDEDLYGQKTIVCEGELTFLNDSVLRPHRYQNQTVTQLLTAYITEHNSQVDTFKQFTVGTVTVTDPNNSVSRFTNYQTTMTEIIDDLVDSLGGYLRIRHENGVRYLDYLAESPNTNTQTVALGKNLISLDSNLSSLDVCSVLVPLGARQEEQEVPGLEARLTIKSVNNNLDYLENATAIAAYGRITKIKTWDDVTLASNLKTKGQAYLTSQQYENLVINATAFDLGLASPVFEQFKLLDTIHVICEPNALDRNFLLTKMTLNLNASEQNTITLGNEVIKKISTRSAEATELSNNIDDRISSASSSAYQEAVAEATALITSAMGGYVYKTRNELYIMDTNDLQTATKVWRWNINGLGYSSTGVNGPYTVAMTMDGVLQSIRIVADNGTVGGWDMSEHKIGKTGTFDISSLDLVAITTIRSVLQGLADEETVLAQHPEYDVDGDGHLTARDISIIRNSILGYLPSSGTYESAIVSNEPYQLVRASSENKVRGAAGIDGLYGDNVTTKHVLGLDDNGQDRFDISQYGLKFYDQNGSTIGNYPSSGPVIKKVVKKDIAYSSAGLNAISAAALGFTSDDAGKKFKLVVSVEYTFNSGDGQSTYGTFNESLTGSTRTYGYSFGYRRSNGVFNVCTILGNAEINGALSTSATFAATETVHTELTIYN